MPSTPSSPPFPTADRPHADRCRGARRLGVASLLVAWAGFGSLPAEQVEVHLTSGQVVRGTLISQDDATVVLRETMLTHGGPLTGEISYDRDLVGEVVPVPPPAEAYAAKAKAADGSFASQLALAAWCAENGLREPGKMHALRALQLQPENGPALNILDSLDYLRVDDSWVDAGPYLAAHHLVRFHRYVMAPGDADQCLALERLVRARDAATQSLIDQRAAIAQAIASGNNEVREIDRQVGALTALRSTIASQQTQLAALQKQLAAARKGKKRGTAPSPTDAPDVTALRNQIAALTASIAQDQRSAADLGMRITSGTAFLDTLKKRAADASAALDGISAAATAAQGAVDAQAGRMPPALVADVPGTAAPTLPPAPPSAAIGTPDAAPPPATPSPSAPPPAAKKKK